MHLGGVMVARTFITANRGKYQRLGQSEPQSPGCCCVACWVLGISLMIVFIVLLPFSTWLVAPCNYNLKPVNSTVHYRPRSIAFGSCQDNWIDHKLITRVNADVFIYLGDNIYGDDGTEVVGWFPRHWLWYRKVLYNKLSCRTSFQKFVDRTPYVLSIWDDHDYGTNDDNFNNPIKMQSQASFLDFWKVPSNSERRKGKGIFGSHRFELNTHTILVLLLDLRWYNGITKTHVLGSEQLDWIESEVNKIPTPNLVVVASALQFSSNCSDNFRGDRQRLQSLLNPSKTIFISGDVHSAGIYRSYDGFLDITSSPLAMTYPWSSKNSITPDERCGAIGGNLYVDNFGYLDLEAEMAYVHGIDGSMLSQTWSLM